MPTILPNAKNQFFDANGKPLASGQVYFYIPNTSTPKATYQDPGQTILNTNPVILDAAGEAIIWGSGTYRQVVYDANSNLIWDQITEDTSGSLLGNMVDNIFVAGTDFTPGTTTQLTLTAGPGSINNTWIYFDAAYQDDTQASVNGTTLTFHSPIPVGVGKVTVKIGSSISIGTPSNGTVTDSSVSPSSHLYNRINDLIDVMDFGTKGDGVTDDTAAMNSAIGAATYNYYPNKTFSVNGAFTLPFNKQLIMMPGAQITPSGGGSATLSGMAIQFGYNPSGIANWTTNSGSNYEGISVDVGGYGPRNFGTIPLVTGVNGSVNIPASATIPAHACGTSGYAKTASTSTGAVGLYGEANSLATGALAFGLNTKTVDNGFVTTVWGAEFDINLTNASTAAFGCNVTGGSTVEPVTGTYGIWVGPLGQFTTPKKRWVKGVFVDDGSAITGVEIGAANTPGGSAGGSMPLSLFFNPNSSGRQLAAQLTSDPMGNVSLAQTYASGGLLQMIVGGGAGVGINALSLQKSGSAAAIGFYGQAPATKPAVTGSKGSNVALASLMTALANLGLVTDSTT